MSIIDHVEKYLGRIDAGWKPGGPSENVSVSRFCNQPVEGMSTYVTLGLSHHALSMPNEREVRQELMFSAFEHVSSEEIAKFLLRIADLIISREEAILRGRGYWAWETNIFRFIDERCLCIYACDVR